MIKISKNIAILLFSFFLLISCSNLKSMSNESNLIKRLKKEKEINNIKYQIKKIEEDINNITNECNNLISSNRNLNTSTLYISKEERNNKLNQNLVKLKQLRQQQIDNFKRIQYLKKRLNSLENSIKKNLIKSPTTYPDNPSLSGSPDLPDTNTIKPPEQPKSPRNDSLKGIANLRKKLEETNDPEAINNIIDEMDELCPPDEFKPEIEVEHSSENEIDIYDFEKLKNYIETCEDINKQDINLDTLLHKIIIAIIENLENYQRFIKFKIILKLLIQKNPDIKIKNNNNQTAYSILNQEITSLENHEPQDNIIKLHIDALKQIEQSILNLVINQYADNVKKLEELLYRSIKQNYLLVFNSLFNGYFSNNIKIILKAKEIALQHSRTSILNILEKKIEILIKQQEKEIQKKIREIQKQIKSFSYKFILNCPNVNKQDELGNTISHYLMLAITTTIINLQQTMFIVNQIFPCLFKKNPIIKIKNKEGYKFHDILNNKINELENNTSPYYVLLTIVDQSIIPNLLIKQYSNPNDIEKLEMLLFNAKKRQYQRNIIKQLKTKIKELRINTDEFYYNNFTQPISNLNLANIHTYIENTESINAQNNNGDTLLHQIIKAIIENINNSDLFNKLRSLLKQFLEKNPNINTKNNNQISAYNILDKEIKKVQNDQHYQSYHSIENLLLNKAVEQNETNQEKLIEIFNIAIEHKHSNIVKKIGIILLNNLPPVRKFRNTKKREIKELFKRGLKKTQKIMNNTSVTNVLKNLIGQI